MLNEILEIPGNRPVFDDLQQLLAGKKAIAFVGAGASAGMYPLWGEFIGKLADYAVDKSKAEPKDRARWKADRTSTPQQRVNTILRKLGEDHYRQFLRETFAPRRGGDGLRYTPTHALLLRLPFRGYVTTNYDPALEFARMDLRPGCLTTGTPTWQDDDEVHRWLTGDVFEPGDACPILWLHGYWQRPAGIVLNAGEYAAAYKPSLYRKTFQRLWEQDHLVFAGFGFNDPQFAFMVGEILRDIAGAHALPRHIAILGLTLDAEGNLPDPDAIAEARANMEEDFQVRPLFYRVKSLPHGGQDHSDLFVLLEELASAGLASAPVQASPATPTASTTIPARWVHETTNDAKFTGREDELARLDRWVADPTIRVVGITAVGGTGKTALVGHWLKNTTGWQSRRFAGLFAWSFYQERDSTVFLSALLEWASEAFGAPKLAERAELVPTALKLLRAHALVVVLDGLEVQQEGPEDTRHGAFLDGALREFLGGLCVRQHESLGVLTSRFVFADLERHLGTAFHQLELPGLTSEQGAALLEELEVRGPEANRMDVSRRLEGHPLGLRVFAEVIPESRRDHPHSFLDETFRTGQLSSDSPLAGKIRRLLVFYQEKLPSNQVRLLSVVALFRAPVAESAILHLARGLFGRKRKQPLPSDAVLTGELRKLHVRGILTREPIEDGFGYACHPILRSHFRTALLSAGPATVRRVCDLLKGKHSKETPSIKKIVPVLLAIEAMLEMGDFRPANELYLGRLENGGLFKRIPALLEGLRCAIDFVQDDLRRRQCEDQLSQEHLLFFLNDVALFATLSGEYDLASHFCAKKIDFAREMKNSRSASIGLRLKAQISIALGRLAESADQAREALSTNQRNLDTGGVKASLSVLGWAESLSGMVRHASEDFAIANSLERFNDPKQRELYSVPGIVWAELLLRAGLPILATQYTIANLRICERSHWNEDIARCHWVLGACALGVGLLDKAEAELRQAETTFYTGQLLFELARLHVTAGSVAVARFDFATALHRAAEALALAQPRGMRLVHADALVLRGRARLLEAETAGITSTNSLLRALDDAGDALRLARECGYPWAERDSLTLQADAQTALAKANRMMGNTPGANRAQEAAHRTRTEAGTLSARLRLTEEDLAEADANAAAWLEEWKRKTTSKDEEA